MLKREVLLHKCRKNPFIITLFCFFFSTNTHDDDDEDDFDDDSYIYLLLPMDGLARDEPFPTSRGKTDAFLRASETVAPRRQAAVVKQTQE